MVVEDVELNQQVEVLMLVLIKDSNLVLFEVMAEVADSRRVAILPMYSIIEAVELLGAIVEIAY